MARFDLPLIELERYLPQRQEPADFDAFWRSTLTEARQFSLEASFEAVDYGLTLLETFDVTFAGYAGQPIKGWLILPCVRTHPLPCVVEYIGYGGGRGFPSDHTLYGAAGYANLVMDTRGQGSGGRRGDTPDPDPSGLPQSPGFMTRGILDPRTYYYRRVLTDAVRAVDAARAHPAVDPTRVVVAGGSQGGGIALAVSALEPTVQATLPDVPFLCHFARATELTDALPYAEIAGYCRVHRDHVARVFETLSYFDGLNFAVRAVCRALFSVGLMDMICPPSTVYAAFNHYAGEKEMRVYPFNGHEGGAEYQTLERLRFLARLWNAPERTTDALTGRQA